MNENTHGKVKHRVLEQILFVPFEKFLVVRHVWTGSAGSKRDPIFPRCRQTKRMEVGKSETNLRISLGICSKQEAKGRSQAEVVMNMMKIGLVVACQSRKDRGREALLM